MILNIKNVLLSSLILMAAGFSGWSIFLSSKAPKLTVTTSPDLPDAFMEEVVAIVMDKNGKISLKVETPKMIHYPENDAIELFSPHVTVFRESPEPWHIQSNYAKTKQGINEITFLDDVVIHHLADDDNPLTTMRTAALTVFPNENIAKTEEAITVTQPDATVQAIGMLANWKKGTVQLLSQARQEYVPK